VCIPFHGSCPTRNPLLPAFAPKRFQRRALAVTRDQPLAVGDDRAQLWFLRSRARRRLEAGALIEFVLRAQIFKQRANLGILSTFPKKRFQLSAGVWKER